MQKQIDNKKRQFNKQRPVKKTTKQEPKKFSLKLKAPFTARAAALLVLCQVLEEGAYTNIAINKFLQGNKLEDLERRFFTELVYGTVKALGTLDWYLEKCVSRPLVEIDKAILNILRLSLYQILYAERIPASAACNEAVNLARLVAHEGTAKFVNGTLRGFLRKQEAGEFVLPDAETQDADYLAVKYWHPRWLVKRWLGPWGREGTERLLAFNNTAAPVCLRANTLVMSRDELLAKLVAAGNEAEASAWSPDGIVCKKLTGLGELFTNFKNAFYVQDESSMLVAPLLDVKPGMQVLDLCSAPGGKTTHLAQLMQNKGRIVACDIHEHKLELIKENALRLGISCVHAQTNDASLFREEWEGAFERVLVDAPCSGMGVLRRRAEARWTKERKDLKLFPPLQLKILSNAARYVKAGGQMVYSTCTIEQAENHYLVEEFLAAHPEWQRAGFKHPLTGEVVDELQLLPQVDNVDGFYICVLRRV